MHKDFEDNEKDGKGANVSVTFTSRNETYRDHADLVFSERRLVYITNGNMNFESPMAVMQ